METRNVIYEKHHLIQFFYIIIPYRNCWKCLPPFYLQTRTGRAKYFDILCNIFNVICENFSVMICFNLPMFTGLLWKKTSIKKTPHIKICNEVRSGDLDGQRSREIKRLMKNCVYYTSIVRFDIWEGVPSW